ncbi:MAG: SirB2 family protein, partial [Azonexus sp.]|nr:SirB2 family protein [Azonexus sp.]
MSYLLLKHLHVTCVVLSGLGFCLRGWWMLRDSPRLSQRLARVAPHVIDSLLLGSAIMMAVLSGQYPFVQGWLTAKFLALLAYILLGM